jgi:hypothetical protein
VPLQCTLLAEDQMSIPELSTCVCCHVHQVLDAEAAKDQQAPIPCEIYEGGEVIDTQKLYSYANHNTVPHEKGGLVAIFCGIMGIDVDTCRRIFGPNNAANDAVMMYNHFALQALEGI